MDSKRTPWTFHESPFDGRHSYAPGDVGGDVSYHGPVHAILDANERVICQDATYYSDAPDVDDMRLIVRAVNAHDDLVRALRDLLVRAEAELADPEDVWEVEAAHQALAKAGEP